jgi:hypothetical protein
MRCEGRRIRAVERRLKPRASASENGRILCYHAERKWYGRKTCMTHYFLLLEAAWFHGRLRPALSASWREKSFRTCQALCAELIESARTFAATYRVSTEESLPAAVAAGLSFDRHLWRCLVGEALLYGASEIPELDMALESLTRLLAPGHDPRPTGPREQLAPILQTHFGAHDLDFGNAIYRPEHVGINDRADVWRLADYLQSVDAKAWTSADLSMEELIGVEDRESELDYTRACFTDLLRLYETARHREQIIVCESM